MTQRIAVDVSKCEELARRFLKRKKLDTDENVYELADRLRILIDNFINDVKDGNA